MRKIALASAFLVCASSATQATEYAFSTYSLGGSAFAAGLTPPPGIYVSNVVGYYAGSIGGAVAFGNVTLNAGAKVTGFTNASNLLYVSEHKLFGGLVGFGVTVPAGHVGLDATVGVGPLSAARSVDGWGLGDTTPRVQIGWQDGALSHLFYVQAVLPTGRWEPGFAPIIGLNRPGFDTGWSMTWIDKKSRLQANATFGFTFNFENTDTKYKSGDEFHFEWALGMDMGSGLVLGLVGYDYRQITGDSGSGAVLGPFKGSVDAIGPGLSYTTLVDKRPLILNLRHYREFNAENRFEGNSTIFSATLKF